MLQRLLTATIAVALFTVSASAASVNDLRAMGYSLLPEGADTIDLGSADLIFQADAQTRTRVLELVRELVLDARNGGRWNGVGLTSNAAARNGLTGLAVVLNERDGKPVVSTFAGRAVDENSVLVAYTWNGDLNLDRRVDADDYFRVDSGFLAKASGRGNGDVNYDGKINADDYFLIDSSFIGQSAQPMPRAASVYAITSEQVVAVPLPRAAWQGITIMGAVACLAALRRRSLSRAVRWA